MPDDDDDPAMALTRSQVLTARGYAPEVIAGNGHAPVVEERRCPCGRPLAKQQTRFCSQECQRADALPAGPAAAGKATRKEAPSPLALLLAAVEALPAEVVAVELVGGWRLTR